MKFTATIILGGKTATGIEVPPDVVSSLSASKRPAVVVSLNGYTYRTTVAPMGGAFWVPLAAEHRIAAGVAAGEVHEVEVTLDSAPREVEVPGDFAEAMAAVSGARERFDRLAYSHRKEHVRAIEEARSAATRRRRIEKALDALR